MKFIDTLIFASGAFASYAPPPYYPIPESSAPAPYSTGAIHSTVPLHPTGVSPPKYPHKESSAPAPYPSEKSSSKSDKHDDETTTIKVYPTKTDDKKTDTLTKPTDTETKIIVYPTQDDKTATETVYTVVVPVKTLTLTEDVSKTKTVIVSPTPYTTEKKGDETETETKTKTIDLTVTAPAPVASVCVPKEETVTITTKLTLTITAPEEKPTGYANKTVTVSPLPPTVTGSFVLPPPSYLPAVNKTTEIVVKPTYSAPPQYTGGAMAKAASGFGALAVAAIAFAL